MRGLATRELLRRAALTAPVLGGLLILGLLAMTITRGGGGSTATTDLARSTTSETTVTASADDAGVETAGTAGAADGTADEPENTDHDADHDADDTAEEAPPVDDPCVPYATTVGAPVRICPPGEGEGESAETDSADPGRNAPFEIDAAEWQDDGVAHGDHGGDGSLYPPVEVGPSDGLVPPVVVTPPPAAIPPIYLTPVGGLVPPPLLPVLPVEPTSPVDGRTESDSAVLTNLDELAARVSANPAAIDFFLAALGSGEPAVMPEIEPTDTVCPRLVASWDDFAGCPSEVAPAEVPDPAALVPPEGVDDMAVVWPPEGVATDEGVATGELGLPSVLAGGVDLAELVRSEPAMPAGWVEQAETRFRGAPVSAAEAEPLAPVEADILPVVDAAVCDADPHAAICHLVPSESIQESLDETFALGANDPGPEIVPENAAEVVALAPSDAAIPTVDAGCADGVLIPTA